MPIVQAGKQLTADSLRADAGTMAAILRDTATNLMQMKAQLETWPDPDLLALEAGPSGRQLSQGEINAIKGFAIGDMPAIYNLITASVWIKQLLGTGI